MDEESDQNALTVTGRRFAWIAIIAVMLGLTAFFHAVTGRQGGIVSVDGAGMAASVILERDRSGHYVAEGAINGQPVTFLVDTGATDVAVSEKMARALGLEFGPRITVMTAAGQVGAWVTRLDRVSLGPVERFNVRATITPGLDDAALLGMSFLKHFSLQQEGDRLLIKPPGERK